MKDNMLDIERDECKKLKNILRKINMILDVSLIEAKESYNNTDHKHYMRSMYYQGQIDALDEFRDNIEFVMREEKQNHEKRTK